MAVEFIQYLASDTPDKSLVLPVPVAAQAVMLMVGAVATMKLTGMVCGSPAEMVVVPSSSVTVAATLALAPMAVTAVSVASGTGTLAVPAAMSSAVSV